LLDAPTSPALSRPAGAGHLSLPRGFIATAFLIFSTALEPELLTRRRARWRCFEHQIWQLKVIGEKVRD